MMLGAITIAGVIALIAKIYEEAQYGHYAPNSHNPDNDDEPLELGVEDPDEWLDYSETCPDCGKPMLTDGHSWWCPDCSEALSYEDAYDIWESSGKDEDYDFR